MGEKETAGERSVATAQAGGSAKPGAGASEGDETKVVEKATSGVKSSMQTQV